MVVLSAILLFTVNVTAFADGSANNENNLNIYDRIDDYLSNADPKKASGIIDGYENVFIISVLPLLFIGKYKKLLQKGSNWRIVAWMSVVHAVFPVFILMLLRIFFGTPLWVVKAFVPDLFVVIIISACLLFAGGIVKMILFIKGKVLHSSY